MAYEAERELAKAGYWTVTHRRDSNDVAIWELRAARGRRVFSREIAVSYAELRAARVNLVDLRLDAGWNEILRQFRREETDRRIRENDNSSH